MQLLNLFVQFATIVSVICAAAAIWASVKMSKKQMNMQVFTTYSDRYEKIMSAFPQNAWKARFSFDTELPPASVEVTLCILKYLNMSSEEYYLWKTGYLDDKVWKIWEHEIVRMLRSPLIRREWPELKSEFESYPDFLNYVETKQRQPQ